jgi:hypothetical protein
MAIRQNTPAGPDRFAELTDPGGVFKNPEVLSFMRTFIEIMKRIGNDAVYRNTAATSLILLSPNGTAYRVTVTNGGVLQVDNARS